jgi:branched-chain amino acid transport system ATP-binding protein
MRSAATRRCRKSIWAARAVLEIADLQSFYGDAHIVQGASLTIAPGEVVALLGRNGMGKTTLIRSIMGLKPPHVRAGRISWRGEDLSGRAPHEIAARRIALVPQGRRLFASLTVTEHLTSFKGKRRNGWTPERIFSLFPRLAERKGHRGSQLSGGERQMLAIARALMIDPELILMDEPSEGLAPVVIQQLEDILLELKHAQMSILLVEQNLYSALAVADRIYILETGRIVYESAKAGAQPELLRRHLGVR